MRRVPQQTRGQQRITTILAAAEQLIAEVGFDAATTNAIAARAHTAIGSLYQFYPNKEAILRALVARFLEQMNAAFDAALAEVDASSITSVDALIDHILDPLLALQAQRAGILHAFFNLRRAGASSEAAQALIEEIISRLDALVAVREPWVEPAKRRLYVQITVEVVRALLPLTIAPDGTQRPEVVAELKRLLRAYMNAVRAEAPHPRNGSARGPEGPAHSDEGPKGP
jgi:AcrR family transcriptional regulator